MSTPRPPRTRPGRRPAPGDGVAVALMLLVLVLVLVGGAAVAAPTPAPDDGSRPGTGAPGETSPGDGEPSDQPSDQPRDQPSDPPSDPLSVTIDELSPSVLPTSGPLELRGRVTNRSESEWTELSVYLVVSRTPITSEAALLEAVDSDPRTDVGDRIVAPGLFVTIADLAPGETTGYQLSVPSTALATTGQPGVHWVAVHVLGTSDEGRLEGADGRARTFLPSVPAGSPGTQLALGLQVRERVQRTPLGRVAGESQLSASLGEHGALGRLVRLGADAGGWPLTWVVDPAVLDAAVAVARGNPPTDLAAEPEDPAPPGDDEESERSAGAQRAEEWLDRFAGEAQERPVLELPYADVDVPAAHTAGAMELVDAATAQSRAFLEQLEVAGSPAVAADDQHVPEQLLGALGPDTTVLLAPEAVEGGEAAGPVLTSRSGRRIVVATTMPARAGPGPNARGSALAVRQRLLAEAALHALSPERELPLVRLLPPSWDPGARWDRASFFAGLEVPWLNGTSLAALADDGPVAGRASVTAPEESSSDDGTGRPDAADEPLPASVFRAAEGLITTGTQLDELLTVNDVFTDEVTRQALTSVSLWARGDPWVAAEQAREAENRVESWLEEVSVRSPSFVTMSSESGTFQVSLVNGLDQPVTVGLEATVRGDGLRLSAPVPVEIAPNGRGAMRIDAVATDIGVHQVTLQAVSASGTAVGEPITLSVRSSRVGFILWVIMAVGGTLLFAAVTTRIFVRVRQRRRTHGPLLARDTADRPPAHRGAR